MPPNRPPSYTERKPLPLIELPPSEAIIDQAIVANVNSYLRLYRLGPASVIVTKEYGQWHMSIACTDRLPAWEEVAEARYRLIPDGIVMAMPLPPKADYVNVHEFCLHLIEVSIDDHGMASIRGAL